MKVDEVITKAAIEKAKQVYNFCLKKVSEEEIKVVEGNNAHIS
jgi:hypothetical protein